MCIIYIRMYIESDKSGYISLLLHLQLVTHHKMMSINLLVETHFPFHKRHTGLVHVPKNIYAHQIKSNPAKPECAQTLVQYNS